MSDSKPRPPPPPGPPPSKVKVPEELRNVSVESEEKISTSPYDADVTDDAIEAEETGDSQRNSLDASDEDDDVMADAERPNSGEVDSAHIEKAPRLDPIEAQSRINQYESDGEYEDDSCVNTPTIPPPPSKRPSLNVPVIAKSNEALDSLSSLKFPRPKKGLLDKQTHGVFKTWKRRYFHLERGHVVFFEPLHWFQEGEFGLADARVANDMKHNDPPMVIRLLFPRSPDLCLQCRSLESKLRWEKAVLAHITYANEQAQLKKSRGRKGSLNASSPVNLNGRSRNGSVITVSSANIGQESTSVTGGGATGSDSSSLRGSITDGSSSKERTMNRPGSIVTLTPDRNSVSNCSNPNLTTLMLMSTVTTVPAAVGQDGVPVTCTGWMHKRGQWWPSIRRRWFVLHEGVLSYYKLEWDCLAHEKELRAIEAAEASGDVRGKSSKKKLKPQRALGRFPVTGYQYLTDTVDGRIELILEPTLASASRRLLVLYCDDYMDRDRWIRAIVAHAEYIK